MSGAQEVPIVSACDFKGGLGWLVEDEKDAGGLRVPGSTTMGPAIAVAARVSDSPGVDQRIGTKAIEGPLYIPDPSSPGNG